MVALDLDGTLLTSDKTISQGNEQALKAIHDEGVKVVLCTGRPINAIWRFIEQLGLTEDTDYTITFNGALVVHNNDKAELAKSGIQKLIWCHYTILSKLKMPHWIFWTFNRFIQ